MRQTAMIAVLASLLLLLGRAGADDWPHLGLDDARSRAPLEQFVLPLAPAFEFDAGPIAVASPVLSDGFLFLAGADGMLRAFRETDGAAAWTSAQGNPLVSTPVVRAGRLYQPSEDRSLHVHRLSDGSPLLNVPTGGTSHGSPLLSGGLLFLTPGFPDARVLAINPTTGAIVWQQPLSQVSDSSPALGSGKLVLGSNGGRLHAFDAATGIPDWEYIAGGAGLLSSPLISGGDVFYLPGGEDFGVHRVALDSATWPAANASALLQDDPAALPAGDIYGTRLAVSSPTAAGGRILFTARFEYNVDSNADFFIDSYKMNEHVFGLDPVAMTWWRVPLGTTTVPKYYEIPLYGTCPTPASVGTGVVVASSVSASLQVLDPATGAPLQAPLPLAGICLASPVAANGRVYAVTTAGRVHAFSTGNAAPAAPGSGFDPATDLVSAPASLSWDAVADAVSYLVRLDTDGELLEDWAFEATVAGASAVAPALVAEVDYVWAVRARDAEGAWSAWSAVQAFSIDKYPDPPMDLVASAGNGQVTLTWTASPSPDVISYVVSYRTATDPYGPDTNVGTATATTVGGVANDTAYTFRVRAVDAEGDLSPEVVAVATPHVDVTIGGVAYGSIADALAAAVAGDVVILGPGTSYVSVGLVVPAGVTLRGRNPRDTVLEAAGSLILVTLGTGGTLEGVRLGGGDAGVEAGGTGILVRNVVVAGMRGNAVQAPAGTGLTVVNATIVQNGGAGVSSQGAVTIRNSIVSGNGMGLEGLVTSSYNDVVSNAGGDYAVVTPGVGDLSVAVTFGADFLEAAGAPTVDAGDPSDPFALEPAPNGGRVNQGAYGNTDLARASGPAAGPGRPRRTGTCSASVGLAPGGVAPALFLLALTALLGVRSRR